MGDRFQAREDFGVNQFREASQPASARASETVIGVYGSTNANLYLADGQGTTDERKKKAYQCVELNLELAGTDVAINRYQRACYYFASIANLLPGRRTDLLTGLRGLAINVTVYDLPEDCERAHMDFPEEEPDVPTCIIKFGAIILTMFKNVNETNYEKYIQSRLRALSRVCGHPSLVIENNVVFKDFSHAEDFRAIIGASPIIRESVLRAIMNCSSDRDIFGAACDYVVRLLAWTDMSAVLFINQVLLIPNSPVLLEASVASEVLSLYEAMVAICRHETPQFFRILAGSVENRKLERAKFPLLISVSQAIKRQSITTVGNFVVPANVDKAELKRLLNVHNSHFAQSYQPNIQTMAAFLTDVERVTRMEGRQTAEAQTVTGARTT